MYNSNVTDNVALFKVIIIDNNNNSLYEIQNICCNRCFNVDRTRCCIYIVVIIYLCRHHHQSLLNYSTYRRDSLIDTLLSWHWSWPIRYSCCHLFMLTTDLVNLFLLESIAISEYLHISMSLLLYNCRQCRLSLPNNQ